MVSYYVGQGGRAQGSAWNNIPTLQGEVFMHMTHIYTNSPLYFVSSVHVHQPHYVSEQIHLNVPGDIEIIRLQNCMGS